MRFLRFDKRKFKLSLKLNLFNTKLSKHTKFDPAYLRWPILIGITFDPDSLFEIVLDIDILSINQTHLHYKLDLL